MRRVLRYLRIAFSVTCGFVAVLLCVLWVRSYWWWDWYNSGTVLRQNVTIGSSQGWLGIVIRIGTSTDTPQRPFSLDAIPADVEYVENANWEFHTFHYPWGSAYDITIPHWSVVLSAAIFAVAPWLPFKRFSLRTLLIATTLVAVVLGS